MSSIKDRIHGSKHFSKRIAKVQFAINGEALFYQGIFDLLSLGSIRVCENRSKDYVGFKQLREHLNSLPPERRVADMAFYQDKLATVLTVADYLQEAFDGLMSSNEFRAKINREQIEANAWKADMQQLITGGEK